MCDSVILRLSWLNYMMGLDRNLPAREKELTEGWRTQAWLWLTRTTDSVLRPSLLLQLHPRSAPGHFPPPTHTQSFRIPKSCYGQTFSISECCKLVRREVQDGKGTHTKELHKEVSYALLVWLWDQCWLSNECLLEHSLSNVCFQPVFGLAPGDF